MTEVVFVHGIGVRDQSYPQVLPALKGLIDGVREGVRLTFCFWGESFGADSLVEVPQVSMPVEETDSVTLWSVLEADPMFELQFRAAMLTASSGPPGLPSVEDALAGDELAGRLKALPDNENLAAVFARAGLDTTVRPAVFAVLDAVATSELLLHAHELDEELRRMLARAVVAMAMARASEPGAAVPLSGEQVEDLVELVIDALGGSHLGLKKLAFDAAGRLAGRWAAGRRDELMAIATPYVGDVARYLTRGQQLRDHIAEVVRAAEPPVVLVGHSLGGVACVDLLASDGAPPVDVLLTVGSQVSYFHRIDALPVVRRGDRLPRTFPRWTNVFDPHDLLSFPARQSFKGFVVDHEIDNGAPFPRAHVAYFGTRAFRDLLDGVLPR